MEFPYLNVYLFVTNLSRLTISFISEFSWSHYIFWSPESSRQQKQKNEFFSITIATLISKSPIDIRVSIFFIPFLKRLICFLNEMTVWFVSNVTLKNTSSGNFVYYTKQRLLLEKVIETHASSLFKEYGT